MTMSLSKTGWVPGEKIQFSVRIKNMSTRQLGTPTVCLNQQFILMATQKTKKVSRAISCTILSRTVDKNRTEEFNDIELVVPPRVCPSTLSASRIMQVSYFVDLSINKNGGVRRSDLKIPVVIGTVPLKSGYKQPGNLSSVYSKYANDKKNGITLAPYPYFRDFTLEH